MRKLKIYLDTSVISHLKQEDVPDKMSDTLQLWEDIKSGLYDVYISDAVLVEIDDCKEPKHSVMLDFLKQINFIELRRSEDVTTLATAYISNGVLNVKSYDDCLHLAFSTIHECDVIVSWNFKHIVNLKTMTKVNGVNKLKGYKEIQILPPSMLIERND